MNNDLIMDTENTETTTILFSMPELTGTELRINGDVFELYAKNEKLTDGFLNAMVSHFHEENVSFSYTLYGDTNYETPVILHFSDNSLRIEKDGTQYDYALSFKDFCQAFFCNVRKYAIYWAAPANYRAWFFASFDDFVKKAERYRSAGNEIISRLPF